MTLTDLGGWHLDEVDFVTMKWEGRMHNYMAIFSVTIVFWEWLIALRKEGRYIWRCPSHTTKMTYLFARYFALVYLLVNVPLSFRWTARFPLSKSMCLRWYVQHTSAFSLQYIASHVTLLRRVMQLNKGRDVALTFGAYHLAELVGTIVSAKGTVTSMKFDPSCHSLSIPKDVFLYVGLFVSGQIMIWSLIMRGIWRQEEHDSVPLDYNAKVLRIWSEGDGKAIWAVCFLGLIFFSLYSFAQQQTVPTSFFVWPIAFLSIATCRFILSTEEEAHNRAQSPRTSIKGKERAVDQHEDAEDVSRLAPTSFSAVGSISDPVSASSSASQSSDSLVVNAWHHPTALRSFASLTSFATEDLAAEELVVHTSPSNSITSCERRRTSRSASMESGQTVQTEITTPSGGSVQSSSIASTHIEISSMRTTSSMDSEELREFWNEAWDGTAHQVGSFIA